MSSEVEQADVSEGAHGANGVPIFINKEKVTVMMPVTGAHLRELGHIPANNQLFLEVDGRGQDELIDPTKSYTLKPGSHLYDLPVGTVGAR